MQFSLRRIGHAPGERPSPEEAARWAALWRDQGLTIDQIVARADVTWCRRLVVAAIRQHLGVARLERPRGKTEAAKALGVGKPWKD